MDATFNRQRDAASVVPLVGLTDSVPVLWDTLEHACLRKLLSVSPAVKHTVQEHLTYIKLADKWQIKDMKCLATGKWSCLTSMDLSAGHLDATAAIQLGGVSFPNLRSLVLAEKFPPFSAGSRAYEFKNFQGKWPLLKTFYGSFRRLLDRADVSTLIDLDWPCLESLTLQVSPSAFPLLAHARWPHLQHLSIGKLDSQNLADFCSLPLPHPRSISIQVTERSRDYVGHSASIFSPILRKWPHAQLIVWSGAQRLLYWPRSF